MENSGLCVIKLLTPQIIELIDAKAYEVRDDYFDQHRPHERGIECPALGAENVFRRMAEDHHLAPSPEVRGELERRIIHIFCRNRAILSLAGMHGFRVNRRERIVKPLPAPAHRLPSSSRPADASDPKTGLSPMERLKRLSERSLRPLLLRRIRRP